MSKCELEVQHRGTDVGEYSIFSCEKSGGTYKSFMDEMADKVIDDIVAENVKKLIWYRKEYCCSITDFARKFESTKKLEIEYYKQHKTLFDYLAFPYSDITPDFYSYYKYSDKIEGE